MLYNCSKLSVSYKNLHKVQSFHNKPKIWKITRCNVVFILYYFQITTSGIKLKVVRYKRMQGSNDTFKPKFRMLCLRNLEFT